MAWFTPAEHPDEKYYIFGKEGGVRMAEKYGIQLLGRKSSRNPILTQHLIIPGPGRGFYVEENLNITFNSNIFVVKSESRGSERSRVPQRDIGIVV